LTALGRRNASWLFNLEVDTISKTVVSWLERRFGSAEDSGGILAAKKNSAGKK
jgi:hypothetical protein